MKIARHPWTGKPVTISQYRAEFGPPFVGTVKANRPPATCPGCRQNLLIRGEIVAQDHSTFSHFPATPGQPKPFCPIKASASHKYTVLCPVDEDPARTKALRDSFFKNWRIHWLQFRNHVGFVDIKDFINALIGVKHHTIAEVLSNVEDNWRIIRFNTVTDEHRERMLLRSAYYLQQPYSIRPINGAGAKFSYCSELVNKIYRDSGVRSIKVSKGVMVNPCHFDRLADKGEVCQDITESVRPFAPFFREYKEMIAMQAHAMVAGLKLNRYRDKQRKELLAEAQAQAKAGNLPHETLVKLAQGIQNLESKMNFRFWDSIPR